MGVLCDCPRGCLTMFTLRDTIIPLVRSKTSPPRTNDVTGLPAVIDPPLETQTKNGMYLGGLAHVVSGMFYSVVANRGQPNLYIV